MLTTAYRYAVVALLVTITPTIAAVQPPAALPHPPAITSLTVSPISFSLRVAQTGRLNVAVQKRSPEVIAPVTYVSSDSAVARVDSTGLVTAIKPGTASVTVRTSAAASVGHSAVTLTSIVRIEVTAESRRDLRPSGRIRE